MFGIDEWGEKTRHIISYQEMNNTRKDKKSKIIAKARAVGG